MSLDTIHPKARNVTTFAMLAYAILGLPAFCQQGCDRLQVQDPATGIYRDATPEEKAKLVQDAGNAVTGVVETIPGGTMFAPIIQAITQLGALFVAWRIRPKDQPAAPTSTTAAAAAPPPATPPA